MIVRENHFDEYAYRVANCDIADPTMVIEEGSWVTLDTNGKIIASDGTKKSFLFISSKRTGRDNITPQGAFNKGAFLHGSFVMTVKNSDLGNTAYDSSKTFAVLTPLKVAKDGTTNMGVLQPWVTGTDKVELLVGYSLGAADATNKTLRIMAL